MTLALNNGERTTVSDIKEKVRQSILEQALAEGDSCSLEDIQPPIICIARDQRIESLARSDFCIGNLESGFKLVALERQIHEKDTSKLAPVQIMITQQRSSYMIFRTPQPLTQSRILIFNKESTLRQIKKRIFKYFRPIILQNSGVDRPERDGPDNNEDAIIEKEYKKFFEDDQMDNDNEGIGNRLYKLQVYNNVETKPGYLFTYREKCNLCDREHKDNCDFAAKDDRCKLKHIL